MKRKIKITKKDRQFLMRLFNVSDVTVWEAVSYKYDHRPLHEKIRLAALNRGCEPLVIVEGLETWFSGSPYSESGNDHVMHQSLPNGARIEAYCADGSVEVYKKQELIRRFENVKLSELNDIQKFAAAL